MLIPLSWRVATPSWQNLGDATPSEPCACDGYDKTAVHVVLGVMLLGMLGTAIAAATGAIAIAQPKPSYARRQSDVGNDHTVLALCRGGGNDGTAPSGRLYLCAPLG